MPYILAVKQHIIPVEAVQRVEGIGGGKARSGCQDSYLIREGCQKPNQRALQSVCSCSPKSGEQGNPQIDDVSSLPRSESSTSINLAQEINTFTNISLSDCSAWWVW